MTAQTLHNIDLGLHPLMTAHGFLRLMAQMYAVLPLCPASGQAWLLMGPCHPPGKAYMRTRAQPHCACTYPFCWCLSCGLLEVQPACRLSQWLSALSSGRCVSLVLLLHGPAAAATAAQVKFCRGLLIQALAGRVQQSRWLGKSACMACYHPWSWAAAASWPVVLWHVSCSTSTSRQQCMR